MAEIKEDVHASKELHHHRDHEKAAAAKTAAVLDKRPERHSGTGHPINESPKKDGSGKGNWGTYKDDVQEALQAAKEDGLLK